MANFSPPVPRAFVRLNLNGELHSVILSTALFPKHVVGLIIWLLKIIYWTHIVLECLNTYSVSQKSFLLVRTSISYSYQYMFSRTPPALSRALRHCRRVWLEPFQDFYVNTVNCVITISSPRNVCYSWKLNGF